MYGRTNERTNAVDGQPENNVFADRRKHTKVVVVVAVQVGYINIKANNIMQQQMIK